MGSWGLRRTGCAAYPAGLTPVIFCSSQTWGRPVRRSSHGNYVGITEQWSWASLRGPPLLFGAREERPCSSSLRSRCPLGNPSPLPPGPHSPCLQIPWEEKQERPHLGFSLPPPSRLPALLRGSMQGGPSGGWGWGPHSSPGSAAPPS